MPKEDLSTTKAFTLLELLIVIAVLGGLATIFINTYPASQRRARDAQRRSDIKQYQAAMEIYANKTNGNFFTVTGNLATSTNCGASRLNLPTCPDDSDSSQHYQISSEPTRYVLWAQLEQPRTPTTNFIVCSNGRSGEYTVASNSACPLP